MGKGKICRGIIVFATLFILMAYHTYPSYAAQVKKFDTNGGEVVFLLDASISMDKQDKDGLAIDAVRQAVYSLPLSYQAGLVVYNTNIRKTLPFTEDIAQWDKALNEIINSGYTNAGEAMQQAMGMFSDRENVNRYIVMLTDGEIDMPSQQEKDFSRLQYEKAVEEAKEKGVKIFIVAIGNEWSEAGVHIFDGAEMTDGAIYWEGQSGSVSEIMSRILYERLRFPYIALGAMNHSEGAIRVELPAPGAEYARIILLSAQQIPEISVDCDAGEISVKTGQNFSFIDIVEPASQSVVIGCTGEEVPAMDAYMVVGYKAEIETQVTYRREPKDGMEPQETGEEPPEYRHFADIEISLAGREGSLWNNAYYEGLEIPFAIDGIWTAGKIHNGSIQYSLEVEDLQEAVLELDVSGLSEYFDIPQPITIVFSLPDYPQPEKEPETDYRPLWLILSILALALAVLFILTVKRKRKTKIYVAQPQTSGSMVKKEEIRNCTFTGKLNIYVLQTPDGDDIPPQAYLLFGRRAVKIPLSQVLDSCNIKLGRIGAENIVFCAGPDKALIAMNQSENCTMLRGTEILKKGVGYPVYYNGKLTVVFEDGTTEVEIHYKSIKPSELENIQSA